MTLATLDWAVLLAYLGAILLIGFYFARRNTSTEEYFVGGRRFVVGGVLGVVVGAIGGHRRFVGGSRFGGCCEGDPAEMAAALLNEK